MLNAIAGLVLGYLFFQLVNMNESSGSTDDSTDDSTEDSTEDSNNGFDDVQSGFTLTMVYYEGDNYLYRLNDSSGFEIGYVVGNEDKTSFITQNTKSGSTSFTYEGVYYDMVKVYTAEEGRNYIDEQTNTQPDPIDPVQPQPEPPEDEEDDGGLDYPTLPDYDFGLGQNAGQFSGNFSTGNM